MQMCEDIKGDPHQHRTHDSQSIPHLTVHCAGHLDVHIKEISALLLVENWYF